MSDVFEFLVVMFPLTCSLCLVNSILTASVTKTVDKSESGAMLGLNMAVHSIIRYIGTYRSKLHTRVVSGYGLSGYGGYKAVTGYKFLTGFRQQYSCFSCM